MFHRWVGLCYFLLFLLFLIDHKLWQINNKQEAVHEYQLFRLKRRLGYPILPLPWAYTRFLIYFSIFFTYSKAILWIWFGDVMMEEFLEVIGLIQPRVFQLTFMVWSRLPTMLQW